MERRKIEKGKISQTDKLNWKPFVLLYFSPLSPSTLAGNYYYYHMHIAPRYTHCNLSESEPTAPSLKKTGKLDSSRKAQAFLSRCHKERRRFQARAQVCVTFHVSLLSCFLFPVCRSTTNNSPSNGFLFLSLKFVSQCVGVFAKNFLLLLPLLLWISEFVSTCFLQNYACYYAFVTVLKAKRSMHHFNLKRRIMALQQWP